MSNKRKRKMPDSKSQSINITSDWVKIAITIVIQSIAIGSYLSSVKSDLSHLTSDFTEFKGQMKSNIAQLNDSVSQISQIKTKMDLAAEVNQDKMSKIEVLEKELKDSQEKIQELRYQLKDTTRDINTIRDHELMIKELQKKTEELKEREVYEKKTQK